MIKIMIGLPSKGELKTDMSMCLANLAAEIRKEYGPFEINRAFAAVDDARNMIVDAFLGSDCTHLLFIDWDATFPVHSAKVLIEADKDIIGVNAAKHVSGDPVITHDIDGNEINYVNHEMQKVHAIGMHVTLIKREVFDVIPWPWFFRYVIKEQRKQATEDFTFCKNAGQNFGFETWVHNHLSAEIGHISSNQVKTLEHVVMKQIKEAEKTLMKRKIAELKAQVCDCEPFQSCEKCGKEV